MLVSDIHIATKRVCEKELFAWNGFPKCYGQWDDRLYENQNVPFHTPIQGLGDTGSDASLARAKVWLNECTTKHKTCIGVAQETKLPHRVLDLYPIEKHSANIKLIETENNDCGRYVCLSHCWGEVVPLKTTRENISALKECIALKALPRTFQEAVLFSRKLGIRWLWIDSLCIIQNDDLDWKTEAGKMRDIYSNCFLTIAASKSSNGSQGLFTAKPDPALFVCQVSSNESEMHNVFVQEALSIPHESEWVVNNPENHPWNSSVYHFNPSFPLMTRGWTFQERLLSPRVLHFGIAEMFFECKESYLCECRRKMNTNNLPYVYAEAGLTLKGMDITEQDSWRKVCEYFSRMKLTFPDKDTLPALAGLARLYSQVKEGRYIAGVWETDLLPSLAWFLVEQHEDREAARVKRDERLPSWSWASSNMAVGFKKFLPNTSTAVVHGEIAKVHGADYIMAGSDPFGEIEYAHLDLEGNVLPAMIHLSRIHGIRKADIRIIDADAAVKSEREGRHHLLRNEGEDPPNIWMDPPYQEFYKTGGALRVLLFPLGASLADSFTLYYLIITNCDSDTKVYKRIGLLMMKPFDVRDCRDYTKRMRITLI
ncbi:heterokaryon incompatibility protein-domain-containing protein [Halenospora varia]|nr:heterokaryon incompatibility protein-domain-containing protein [Halenospora varia]